MSFRNTKEGRDVRKLVAALFISALVSCSATQARPQYRDIGIRLSGQLDGQLVNRNGCYRATTASNKDVILILPYGTRYAADGIRLPLSNGGKTIRTGQSVTFLGGYVSITQSPNDEFRNSSCKGDAFIVNSAE